jgi:hypothetical protein
VHEPLREQGGVWVVLAGEGLYPYFCMMINLDRGDRIDVRRVA